MFNGAAPSWTPTTRAVLLSRVCAPLCRPESDSAVRRARASSPLLRAHASLCDYIDERRNECGRMRTRLGQIMDTTAHLEQYGISPDLERVRVRICRALPSGNFEI